MAGRAGQLDTGHPTTWPWPHMEGSREGYGAQGKRADLNGGGGARRLVWHCGAAGTAEGAAGQRPWVRRHAANRSQRPCGRCRPSPWAHGPPAKAGHQQRLWSKQPQPLSAMPLQRDQRSPPGPAWPGPQQLGHPGNACAHRANMANHCLLAGCSLQGTTAHGTRDTSFVRGSLSPITLPPQQDRRQKTANMSRPGGSKRLAGELPISLLPRELLHYFPDYD